MNLSHRDALLALNRISGIGSQTIQKFSAQGFEPAEWFCASAKTLAALGAAPQLIQQLQNFDWRYLAKDLQHEGEILTLGDTLYPPLLKTIASPPLVLFVRGDPSVLSLPQMAVVGTRKPTALGAEHARFFSQALAARGFVVTSGLALGVDGEAHRGALEGGRTIAVLGTSVDHLYPKRHVALAEAIMHRGAVISEFPLGTPPQPENFPRRNRIISGLAAGVLVVEAGLKSGSLITAKYALEQGREVFAIPGSIHSPVSRGCHYLIKEGAHLLESVEDLACILGELPQLYPLKRERSLASKADRVGMILLNCLAAEALSMEELVLRSGLTVSEVSASLTRMTLAGQIRLSEEGDYTR